MKAMKKQDQYYRDQFYILRRLAGVLPLLLIALLAAGCVRKYVRSDIRSYARKLTGRSNLEVSEGYREIQEDEEGYLDHLWTVTDRDSGVVFHILDDYYWALEEVENQLLDDYDSSVFLHLLDQNAIPETRGLYLKQSSQSGLVQAEIICRFTDGQSLQDLYEELKSIRKAAEDAGYPDLKVKYTVQYYHPLREAVQYDTGEGDTTGNLGSLNDEAFALMRKNYLACVLDYRFEDRLAEFTQEEIEDLVHAPDTVRIYKNEGDGPEGADEGATAGAPAETADENGRIYYEGLIGNPRYAGISFGTLYELLTREGVKVSGNAWHYAFKAPDGKTIEISYDFNDLSGFNDSEGKLRKGYYYVRDGLKVRMKAYYANHFEASEIAALTGLTVHEDRPYKGSGEAEESEE